MDDEAIVALYFARSEAALAETERKYGALLRAFALRILGSREDAREVENDTYLGAWNAIPPTRPRVLRHFLARITRNLAFDRLDRRTAQRRGDGMEMFFAELDECIPDRRAGLDEAIEAGELARSIDRFLAALPAGDRAVFLARYYYARSVREIAERFSLTERQVKYRLSRARQALRAGLEKEGITP